MNPAGKWKTALVTGASRGIGRAIARSLATRGVRLALHYHVNGHAAEETRAQLDGEGHILCAADLTDAAAAARLWRGVADAFGQVDILVNNAGLFVDHPPLSTAFDEWNATWRLRCSKGRPAPAFLRSTRWGGS